MFSLPVQRSKPAVAVLGAAQGSLSLEHCFPNKTSESEEPWKSGKIQAGHLTFLNLMEAEKGFRGDPSVPYFKVLSPCISLTHARPRKL